MLMRPGRRPSAIVSSIFLFRHLNFVIPIFIRSMYPTARAHLFTLLYPVPVLGTRYGYQYYRKRRQRPRR